jgi:hypothetical protein
MNCSLTIPKCILVSAVRNVSTCSVQSFKYLNYIHHCQIGLDVSKVEIFFFFFFKKACIEVHGRLGLNMMVKIFSEMSFYIYICMYMYISDYTTSHSDRLISCHRQ